jgi:hypothetical protein
MKKMIDKHPSLPNRFFINFDLKYKFEEDYQIDIIRNDPDYPPASIDINSLEHIERAIELMLANYRFELSLLRVQHLIYKENSTDE